MSKELIKKDFGQAWQGLSPATRLIIYGVGAYGLYQLVTIGTSYLQGKATSAKQEANLKGQGWKKTLSDVEYQSLASQIRNARGWANDDESAIYTALMKLNNPLDYFELEKAFGIEEGGWFGDDETLTEFLRNTLDGKDERIKANNIFAQRNISVRL